MEQGRARSAPTAGPGNKTIATTLLELLAVRGRAGARDRAMRALGFAEGGLAEAPAWLDGDALDRMFVAADLDPGVARAIGHRLCAPDATGFQLYGLGLATPEKAYRRIHALLPRARREALWQVDSMGDARAELVYWPTGSEEASEGSPRSGAADRSRAATMHCALRVGMLEAIPGLYGLLPARVTQTSCLVKGDDACRYAVDWQRGSHAALVFGATGGAMLAAGTLAFAAASTSLGGPTAALLALLLAALGVAAGRAVDLHRQLAAVAGARRGHLALFDQVDAVLAEKLDALSRLDATLERGPSRLSPSSEGTFDEDPLAFVDLRRLVTRSIEKVSPQVSDWAEIRFEADERIRAVVCEPVQVEQVVNELLQNAIEASLGAGESPEILVSLRNVPRGVELTIEDHGQGIDSGAVDETFDPFFDEQPAGLDRGFGLPVCLRIIEAHGGELRIANPTSGGTRVTVLLPAEDPIDRDEAGETA
jgi:anti-sigma regulatory factor (Ser/Thr protein kinase)